ncbi:hypothetical protein [Sphingobacterium sp. JB170]|uniref:DUF1281 family ferredoxin-like fold protein n=1 Tax=Sphingobacterium sp. JB170 TaxID=1434842 RepID=UPI00097EA728|nr:hypothetical protein [Sphingobacterium sp. JB170]SJN50485.1 hypothetical protein FM107_20630 [Sphingobacterium sp. JB170]
MANWCTNSVVFEGKPEAIREIQQLFQTMKEKEEKTEHGQLPDFIPDTNGGYFFNIYWNDGDEGIFQYETKWSPNTEILQGIADRYKVDFIQDYEESGNLVYGMATYTNGILTDTYLDGEDWDAYDFDEETDTYHFEGKEYDSNCEILETLLERKIANQKH